MHVKVLLHYFIGDTKGKDKWLGQYPGNREGVRLPYRDCKCQFHNLSNPNPNCIYLTMADINFAIKRKREDGDAGIEYYCSISMYDIRNALFRTKIYRHKSKMVGIIVENKNKQVEL
jgi:hypothetical protein